MDLYHQQYLHQRFSVKSDAKITAGSFIGTGIWKLMNEERFDERLSLSKNKAWYQFCLVVKIFLGNNSCS